MSETATYRYEITGIDCADCAGKLEAKIRKLDGISNVSLDFMRNSLTYDCLHSEGKEMEERVRELAAKEEPDAVITSKGHAHHHEEEEHHHDHDEDHCGCHDHEHEEHHHHKEDEHHHDHEHHHEHCSCNEETATYRFEITGIDCADCA